MDATVHATSAEIAPVATPSTEAEALREENLRLKLGLARIIQTDDHLGFAIGAPATCADLARAALASSSGRG